MLKRATECLDREACFASIKEQGLKIEQMFHKISSEVVSACLRGEKNLHNTSAFINETLSSINLVLDAAKSEETSTSKTSIALFGLLYLARPLLKSHVEAQRLLGSALLSNFWNKHTDSTKSAVGIAHTACCARLRLESCRPRCTAILGRHVFEGHSEHKIESRSERLGLDVRVSQKRRTQQQ